MSTTIRNEAKQLARTLYIRGLIVGDENKEKAEVVIEDALERYSGILMKSAEKIHTFAKS